MRQNNLRQNRRIIYDLKRKEGLRIQVIKASDTEVEVCTGDIDRTYQTRMVKKGILMPQDRIRNFVYDLAFIAANKNFTSGGFFDKDTRFFMIDRRDLRNFTINLSTYIRVIHSNIVYVVKRIGNYEENAAYILQVQHIDGFDVSDIPLENSPSPSP